MFVRWLGAFGRCSDKVTSAKWEVSQIAREVAAEPLYRGISLLLSEQQHVFVGLVACEISSEFRAGFFQDARSRYDKQGVLAHGIKTRPVRDMHRFKAAWNKTARYQHGEVFFDVFAARAIAIRAGCSPERLHVARDIAKVLGLPIVTIGVYSM